MKKHIFFLVAILLGVIALGIHSIARNQIMSAQHFKAEGIAAAVRQHVSYIPDPEAVRLSGSGYTLNTVGFFFTVCCLIFLVVALVRRESGWYSIPILLLISDIFVLMLL